MSITVSLFCVVLEFLDTYLLLKALLGKNFMPNSWDFIFFFVALLWIPIPDSYGLFALVLGNLTNYVYFFLQAGKKPLSALIIHCTVNILLYLIQGLSSLLLFPVMASLPIHYLPVLGSTVSTILFLICSLFFPVRALFQIILNGKTHMKFLVLNTYLVTLIITSFYKTHMDEVYTYTIWMFLTLILILSVNLCIFFYENELRKKEQALLTYKKNKPLFENLIDDIRSNQHEYQNRIQSIAMLPNVCSDYETLSNALMKYTDEYNTKQNCYALLTLNMPLIASTLYNLFSMAKEHELSMFFDIPNPVLNCRISEHIVVDFLHILTQNAIEACSPGDYIYITMLNHEETFYFEVQNPVKRHIPSHELERFFHKGYSTKNNAGNPKPSSSTPHGYGLHELLTQVNKLGGTVSADCVYHENANWMIFSLAL